MQELAGYAQGFFGYRLAGIPAYTFAAAFGIIFFTLVLRRLVAEVVLGRLQALAARTKISWDEAFIDAARPPLRALILAYGLWLACFVVAGYLDAPSIRASLQRIGQLIFLVFWAWLAFRLTNVARAILSARARDPKDWVDEGIVPLLVSSLRLLVLVVFVLLIAQNLGYSIAGLIASLGIGGAAIALASQDTVANLFGSMMILVDKPFKVGDWISGDGFEGVVEEIGFRSTRIRTFAKTVENIPNNMLANVKVENMDRRRDPGLGVRRVKMTVGVTYSTTADQMERALEEIRAILRKDEGVDGRMTTLVHFTDFGASSLDIFVYYFTNKADWSYYLEVRERVNLKIMRSLEEQGLSIAFPTRSIHIESLPPSALAERA